MKPVSPGEWLCAFFLGAAVFGKHGLISRISKRSARSRGEIPSRQLGEEPPSTADRTAARGHATTRAGGYTKASEVYAQVRGVEMELRGARRGYTKVPEMREHPVQPVGAGSGIELP